MFEEMAVLVVGAIYGENEVNVGKDKGMMEDGECGRWKEREADIKGSRFSPGDGIFKHLDHLSDNPRVSGYQEEKERKKQQFIILHLQMQLSKHFITLALPTEILS